MINVGLIGFGTVGSGVVRLLTEQQGNVCVVGDEDQSIYRWRGADYRNVLRFEEDYPDCQKILLEQNYRSTQNVIDTARAVIDHNANRTPKNLFTERGSVYIRIKSHRHAKRLPNRAYQINVPPAGLGRGSNITEIR